MSNTQSNELFDAFADDLLIERTARPLIIIGASKIDNLLLEILSQYLLPKVAKAKDSDELLESDRPLATFSARIRICYRLGLIDTTFYKDLEKLRALRNLSAHSIEFNIFKSPVREHFANLLSSLTQRQSFKLIKERYFDATKLSHIEELQCTLLTLCALLEAIRKKTTMTKGNEDTLKIASR